jgi:polyribonucleotide nucleotidyltransferase
MVVVGTLKAITMVEASAKEVPEAEMVQALELAHEAISAICDAQVQLVALGGKEKMDFAGLAQDAEMLEQIRGMKDRIEAAHRAPGNKHARNAAHKACLKAIVEEVCPADADGNVDSDRLDIAKRNAEEVSQEVFREVCLSGKRYDDRAPSDVRDLECEASFLPRTHGSAFFQRGETQTLSVVTLGTKREEQLIEGLHETYYRKFMLHYNFPNFCVGDTKPIRGTSRREVGHGKLGERALQAVLPAHEDFPYTVRIVSETLESNGSSSMASVCAGTLALMDAGVKISQPVAGIAMGLIKDGEREVIMTDIAGKEDAWGDMDFKVAGTQRGITALQMDIKIDGVSSELMQRALEQAKDARIHILKTMLGALRRPRTELNRFAPRLERIYIPKDKIGAIIGPGGKIIRQMQDDYEVTINVDDDGAVTIYSTSADGLNSAKAQIEGMTQEAEIGRDYVGKVISIKDFGAFLEIAPGMEALCHVSELDDAYVERPDDVVQLGDEIKVRCINVDPSGKVKVSRKAVIREEKGLPPEQSGGDRGGRGGGRRGGGDRGGRGGPRRDRR